MTTYTVRTNRQEWVIYANDRLFDWGQDFETLYQLCGELSRQGQLVWGNSNV